MDEASKRNFTTLAAGLKKQIQEGEEKDRRISVLERKVTDLESQLNSLRGLVMSNMKIGPTAR